MTRSKWRYRRLFEILPGALAWTLILLPILLAAFSPKLFAVYMIFFISYWLVKTYTMSYRMIWGYRNYVRETSTDWADKLAKLVPADDWRKIYHLVIVPTYKEDISILRSSIKSVIASQFPPENIIYVLATEERDFARAKEYGEIIVSENKDKLFHVATFMHPKDMPGEIVGKGGNINFAARSILSFIDEKKIPYENVVVTTMDVDHIVDKKYFADLTFKYVTDEDPIHKSFQPLPMFFNNIWDVPTLNRLIAMGSSFWQLIVATRPSRLRNFSAHAQSLAALIQTDFWSAETIVEDGHQYWRSYFRFDGHYEVVPLYTPIYQDAVLADTLKETLREQYLQKRRWSWGVSDIPYVMEKTFGNKKIPFIDRWANALILWDAHLSWSTSSIILAFSSWLPLLFNQQFKTDILSFSFLYVYVRMLWIAWGGMIITLCISTLLAPPKRGKKPVKRIIMDWIMTPILLPISSIVFSSIPALESQTRLMIGKYLEKFHVTAKSTRRSWAAEEKNGR
ncbi:MAG: glycosyltransferase family 2 protein [Candidatus Berkelbacteria bacterium]